MASLPSHPLGLPKPPGLIEPENFAARRQKGGGARFLVPFAVVGALAAFRPTWLESALREIERQDAHDGCEIAQAQARAGAIQAEITAHQARHRAELATVDSVFERKSARQPRRQALARELGTLRPRP